MDEINKKQFEVSEDIVASIPQRLLNYLIDAVMQVILLMVFAFAVLIIFDLLGKKGAVEFFQTLDKNTIGLYTLCFSISLFYFNFFEILFSRTIGKFITQTIVIDENGERPNHETILIRSLCRLIPFDPLSLLISQGRAWHDSISKTYVVDKKKFEEKKRLYFGSLKSETSE